MNIQHEPLGAEVPQGFIRLKATVQYDGTNFSGWGLQPDQRTVQGVVEAALMQALRWERLVVQCAGRTDAGVHATGQVFHVDVPLETFTDCDRLQFRLNSILDDDVAITELIEAPAGFDARFSALSRSYEYRIHDGVRTPLTRNYIYNYTWVVDSDLMAQAAPLLLGLHDFSSFCKPKDFGTSIRELQEVSVHRDADGVIVVRVTADAFCYSMVRMIVGALLDIGAGRRPVEWITEYLEGKERESGVFVAPSVGLTFVKVNYPPDDELAARAHITRRTRVDGDPDS